MLKNIELKAENIKLEYDNKIALQKINFELNSHELVAIIGPNGAGKSTLLKILSQSLKPSEGIIYLNQKDLQDISKNELARIRAFVSAEENTDSQFITVNQYLYFGRAPYQSWFGTLTTRDKLIIEKCIEATGIQEFLLKNISELSSGEHQRVQIARALAQEPKVLLLDEPTSHLDIKYQLEIMNLLKKISLSGVKIITILHDLNLAGHFCDRLMLLDGGELLCFDTPSMVLTEENLEKVFKNKWEIFFNPFSNSPKVYPKLKSNVNLAKKPGKLHIIGNGGTGTDAIKLLKDSGFELSVGIINVIDSEYQLAKELNLSIIEDDSFSPFKEETRNRLKNHLINVDYIYLSKVSFSEGNLVNLEEVFNIKSLGKVVITEGADLKNRDFSNGKATALWNRLRPDYTSLMDFLKSFEE